MRKGTVALSHRSIALIIALFVVLTASLVVTTVVIAQKRPMHLSYAAPIVAPIVAPTNATSCTPAPARIAIDPNAGYSAPVTYPQVGYMKHADGSAPEVVLPVYGRASFTRSGRGFYYTIIPVSGIKVPLHSISSSLSRDCMDGIGCEDMYTGDEVTVPDAGLGRDARWKVVIYKYNRT